MIRMLSG